MPRRAPAARGPRKAPPRPAPRKERGVEERTLPDGSWERVFHGASMKDPLCVNALRETGEKARAAHEAANRVRVRGKNDPVAGLIEAERADEMERKGELRAVHDIRESGYGPGRPGCDGCGTIGGRLRYVEGHGCVCASCRERIEEARERGLAGSAI